MLCTFRYKHLGLQLTIQQIQSLYAGMAPRNHQDTGRRSNSTLQVMMAKTTTDQKQQEC
jgi:hypothetical protein